MRYVFDFDHDHSRPPLELRADLGGKGAGLAEMSVGLALPVPPGFTIVTQACREFRQHGVVGGLGDEVASHLRTVEDAMRRRLGDSSDPLLLSVRSGAAASMPGMMDTVLNLGLNDELVAGLAAVTGDQAFAWDCYLRFLVGFGGIVLGADRGRLEQIRRSTGGAPGAGPSEARARGALIREAIQDSCGRGVPDDPAEQLAMAIDAVFTSWDSARAIAYRGRAGIDHEMGTAVNVQAMVFGNRPNRSGTGVVFTRNPNTGAPTPYGDFLQCAQGEDVVGGEHRPAEFAELEVRLPDVHAELISYFPRLETRFADMCDIEFTVEEGRLWVLQARAGKRSAAAAVRIALDLASGPDAIISRYDALGRLTADEINGAATGRVDSAGDDVLGRGLAASPGVATGMAYFDPDDCMEAADRGERVVMVTDSTSPEHVHGIQVAEAIVTAHGGLVSHAAVVARGWGLPAVVGVAELSVARHSATFGGDLIREGDVVTVDGSTGCVFRGEAARTASGPGDEIAILNGWLGEESIRHPDDPHLRTLQSAIHAVPA